MQDRLLSDRWQVELLITYPKCDAGQHLLVPKPSSSQELWCLPPDRTPNLSLSETLCSDSHLKQKCLAGLTTYPTIDCWRVLAERDWNEGLHISKESLHLPWYPFEKQWSQTHSQQPVKLMVSIDQKKEDNLCKSKSTTRQAQTQQKAETQLGILVDQSPIVQLLILLKGWLSKVHAAVIRRLLLLHWYFFGLQVAIYKDLHKNYLQTWSAKHCFIILEWAQKQSIRFTLKSISPRASSEPRMSLRIIGSPSPPQSFVFNIKPMATPATDPFSGTPASSIAKQPPQTEAILCAHRNK